MADSPVPDARWLRIKALFASAVEQPPDALGAWLDAQCGDDLELRNRLESLIGSHQSAAGFMETPAIAAPGAAKAVADRVVPSIRAAMVDRRVGPYRLVRELGRGGMGVVYLAERDDEAFRRQVAIKMVHGGVLHPSLADRFHAERHILARLEHVNIAQLLDAGTDETGTPFAVMEYVEGTPIDAFVRVHRLSIARRLELFCTVCDAVQYSHERLVVHRDIKPGNVFVTKDGVPKLLDFGIAKLLDTSGAASERTRTDLRALTPESASPEQVRGDPITVASDVYSLGVLLFRLLTDTSPYRGTLRTDLEMAQAICEEEAPRPSEALADGNGTLSPREKAARRRELKGELDWITIKALEKDRTRRYGTASDLAADIRRHLSHQPVLAGPPDAAYRARKFVRRHRFGVAAAATLVLLLVAFAATMAVQAKRIAQQRDRADREAETAQQVSSFLVGLFEVSKPSEAAANSISAREILDKGAARIAGELQDQPATRAALLATMGSVYQSVGLYAKAQALDEEALTLRRRVFGPGSAETASSLADLARVLALQAQYAEAERNAREALALRRSLLGNEHVDVADSLSILGWILAHGKAQYAEAERMDRESLRILRKALGDGNPRVAKSLNNLGSRAYSKGDYLEAERLFREAHEIRRKTLGPAHPDTLACNDNLAGALIMQKKLVQAEAIYQENLTQESRSLGAAHPRVTQTWNNLGAVFYLQHRYRAAEAAYRTALAIRRNAEGDDHRGVALTLGNLGQALDAEGRYVEAETTYREALGVNRRALGSAHPEVATTLAWLSGTLHHLGRFGEAEAAGREALDINRRALGPDHPRTKEAEGALGAALSAERRWPEAEPLLLSYDAALESRPDVEGNVREVREQIIGMYTAWGKPEKAAEWRQKLPPSK